MLKKTLTLLFVAVFLIAGTVSAQEERRLPDPGILPGSPFYFLDLFGESLGSFFTFGNSAKAIRHLELAEERLAEAEALVEKGETKRAEKAVEKYEERLEKALQRAEDSDGGDLDDVLERIAEATVRHQEVLAEVYGKVPEEAHPGIERAIENSAKGHDRALDAVSDEHEDEVRDRVRQESEDVEVRLEALRKSGVPIPVMEDKREGREMEEHMDDDTHPEGEHMNEEMEEAMEHMHDDTHLHDDDCDDDTGKCNNTPTSADNAPEGSLHNLPVPEAVSAVRIQVAKELGISEGLVIVMEAHKKTWTNGCLDLAGAEEFCTEALVPGYEVTVQAQGLLHTFHTNSDGTHLRENKNSKAKSDEVTNRLDDDSDGNGLSDTI